MLVGKDRWDGGKSGLVMTLNSLLKLLVIEIGISWPGDRTWPIGGARFDKIVARKLTQRCWDEWPLWSRQIAIRCASYQPKTVIRK